MPKFDKSQEAVLALLSELEESGIRSLPLTSLVKFVYLVDYSHAKESSGAKLTSLGWRFLHFGPFDGAVMTGIDGLEHMGWVNRQAGGGIDKDYQLYSLAESITRRTLESIGLSVRAAGRVRQYLQDYARDQSKLLNFVYFQTEPMDDATPEAMLDFSSCRADRWQDIKPLKTNPIQSDALKAHRERIATRHAAEDAKMTTPIIWQGQYDDVYFRAMDMLDATEAIVSKLSNNPAILAL